MKKNGFYGFRETGKSKLQSFALEIEAECQLKCGNCYRSFGNAAAPMPAKFVKRIIKEAKETGFAEIVLIGGEPTMHPLLPEFTEMILKEGLSPIICTNGIRLADKEYCKKILLPGTTIVIHGLIPIAAKAMDKHVKLKGYAKNLQEAYRNIEAMRTKDMTIVAEAVAIKPFLPKLMEFHKWCRVNGYIPFIELNRRGNNEHSSKLSVSAEELKKTFEELQIWDKNHYPNLADKVLTPPAYGTKCTMSITGLHVKNFSTENFSGVYSCCAQDICHGDLRKKSLQEILSDDSMIVFKEQDDWIVGPCKKCEHYSLCRGGCRGEAALKFGCPRASCPTCWHIPAEIRNDHEKMAPANCKNCPLESHLNCYLKKDKQ